MRFVPRINKKKTENVHSFALEREVFTQMIYVCFFCTQHRDFINVPYKDNELKLT